MDAGTRVIIQARMSSSRFPGKVLAPLRGRPVIDHVIERVARAVPRDQVTVATSRAPTDDPLAAYLATRGVDVFRGPLEDVFERFAQCVEARPAEHFARVSADSPLLDPALLSLMVAFARGSAADLVTNVLPRTFPPGHSVEVVRTDTFLGLRAHPLTADQREHVTRVFYDRPADFRIAALRATDPDLRERSYTVDTVEDLARLEAGSEPAPYRAEELSPPEELWR